MIFADEEMTVGCDSRLIGFGLLGALVICFYAVTQKRYFGLKVISFRRTVGRTGADNETKPVCSFAAFRNYLRKTGSNYLPGGGQWKRKGGKLERFEPDLCSLPYGNWVPRNAVSRCFAHLGVFYVVILGDSNALRLYKVIRRTFSAPGSMFENIN